MHILLDIFDDYGIPAWIPALAAVLVILLFFLPLETFKQTYGALALVGAPLAVIALSMLFVEEWMAYVRTKEFFTTEYILLELRLPTEITQSPLAMETALNAFYHTGEPKHAHERYIQGKMRPQFSLEIASFEGDVRFYVWTRAKLRKIIEAQLYSQYPTIEIHEVPDYVSRIKYDRTKINLFGIEQKLQKADPYPIRTYVEFDLAKETDERYKIDPMNAILEFMGSMGKGEYAFFQMIVRSHIDDRHVHGTWFGKEDWKAEADREINKIIEKHKPKTEGGFYRPLTKGEENTIAAIARNTGKKPFDTGIRILYIAENDRYTSERHAALPTMMRTFEAHDLNGFKPVFPTAFKYKWMDPFGKKAEEAKRELFDSYRWRSYLESPYPRPFFILSAEEIATVFHLPGAVAQTPTLSRIVSRRGEAPPNLPRT